MKLQMHRLTLVYPPITNQEAEWLRVSDEAGLRERFSRSNLYMIGHRAEAKFANEAFDQKVFAAKAEYTVDGLPASPFAVDLREAAEHVARHDSKVDIEIGPKLIRTSVVGPDGKRSDVLDWFTVEKLLFDRWRGHPDIQGLDDYRRFSTYELLYVGISKKGDSFTRLIDRAHEKRTRILSNARPKAPGARLTDELVVFLFDVETLHVHTLKDLADEDKLRAALQPAVDKKRLIADAEKAFASLLKSEYNSIKYDTYPRGTDGLYGQGIDRYTYLIDEDITFQTAAGTMRGAYGVLDLDVSGAPRVADMIVVEGNSARLVSYEEMAAESGAGEPDGH